MNNFQIGEASIDVLRNQIAVNGTSVRVEPRVMKVLVRLVDSDGLVVTREDLLECAWEGGFASDEALTKAVSHLRKALGDDDRTARVIETVPKTGYRLSVEVRGARDEVRGARGDEVRGQVRGSGFAVRGTQVRWLWGAVAALLLLVVGQWQNHGDSVSDFGQQTSRVERKFIAFPESGIPVSLASLGLTDSTLARAKTLTLKKVECPHITNTSDSDFELYSNEVDYTWCSDEDAMVTETVTIVNPSANPDAVRSLIADALP